MGSYPPRLLRSRAGLIHVGRRIAMNARKIGVALGLALHALAPVSAGHAQSGPSTRQEVATRVAEWEEKYGRAAVELQRALLARCVAAGAELGTEVTILGEVASPDKRYLGLVVDTGLVFEHEKVRTPAARAGALFGRVVAPALRMIMARSLEYPGIWLELRSWHAPAGERDTLLERLRDPSLAGRELVHVAIGREEIEAFWRGELDAAKLAQRARLDVDGKPVLPSLPE